MILLVVTLIIWSQVLSFYENSIILINGSEDWPLFLDNNFEKQINSLIEKKIKDLKSIENYTKLGQELVRFNLVITNNLNLTQDLPNHLKFINFINHGYVDFSFESNNDSSKIEVNYGDYKYLGNNLDLAELKERINEKFGSAATANSTIGLNYKNVLRDEGGLLREGLKYYGNIAIKFKLICIQRLILFILSWVLALGLFKLLSKSKNFIIEGI